MARNVMDVVDSPRNARCEMRVLDLEEAKRLLQAAREDRLEALYVLALTTGMRQGELLGLKWSDLDLESGHLFIRTPLVKTENGKGFGEPKSHRGRRPIMLTTLAVEALKRHRKVQAEEQLRVGPAWLDKSLVFTNEVGGHIDDSNLRRRSFKPLLRKAGLSEVRFHDLRHSAATLLLSLGIHPKIVQEMLGHSQISVTMDIYSHVLPTMQKDAITQLDRLLGT